MGEYLKKTIFLRQIAFAALFLIFFSCCSVFSYAEPELKSISFLPLWSPQAQFAGYYVAFEKGFYRDVGLDVKIMTGGPTQNVETALKEGKADIGMMWLADAMRKRGQGLPIVNIAQILQRSALMLVAKKSSGIHNVQDIDGKRVSVWDNFLLQPIAFFKKNNLNVTIISQGYSSDLFLRGGVDICSAMLYNEYHSILNAGLNPEELTTFSFSDYGFNFPEDGLYMLETAFHKDPALATAFVKATFDGWRYAFTHKDETIEIILRYMRQAHVPASRVHQKWMLNAMETLIFPADNSNVAGKLKQDDYLFVANELEKYEKVTLPDYNSFHVDCVTQ